MGQELPFGYWLRRKRKALDLTQAQFAERVGCSKAAIRKFEAGERYPSQAMAERLAEILAIPLQERLAFRQFARGRGARAVEEADWQPPDSAPSARLPAPMMPLIGRQQELAALALYLADESIRLITLVGPLGVGKTHLALATARAAQADFPDGVYFVNLAPVEDPAQIAPTLIQTLGYVARADTVLPRLIAGIGAKRLLLALDNCEHLVEGVADLISALLAGCPNLKILSTSRESLRIPGEWLFTVPPLAAPAEAAEVKLEEVASFPALELFSARARAVRADFRLSPENLPTVAAICARLDGLPLAIELTAARLHLLTPTALLERLAEQWLLSANGRRAVTERQQTLLNAIQWSYDLLSAEEQRLLAYLSVFAGCFTLDAAEVCFGASFSGKSVAALVESLLDKSLLQRAVEAQAAPRFQMLYIIRQFALARLRLAGEEAFARQQHLAYYFNLVSEADQAMHGPDQVVWIDRLEQEHVNLRAALEWCLAAQEKETALRLLQMLGWAWEVRSYYNEARAWLDQVHPIPRDERALAAYARALNHVGRHTWTQGNIPEARRLLTESQRIAESLGAAGEIALAEALNWLGLIAHYNDHADALARSLAQRGLELYQKNDDAWGSALSLFHLALAEMGLGDDDAALALFGQSLDFFRKTGDLFFIARIAGNLGSLFRRQGDLERSRDCFEEQLCIDQELRFWSGISWALRDLSELSLKSGDASQAEQYHAQRLAVCHAHGLTPD